MNIFKILLQFFLFFQVYFFVRCDNSVKIIDDDLTNDFDSNWIRNTYNFILVKMEKKDDLDDYSSTFSREKTFNHEGNEYKIKITVSKGHNLTYDIKKKIGDNFSPLPEDEKMKFYKIYEKDDKGNPIKLSTDAKSFLNSNNWVLSKIKSTNSDNYYYAFTNSINYTWHSNTFYDKTVYCALGYWANIEEFYFIYSNLKKLEILSSTIDNCTTQLKFIDLKGLNTDSPTFDFSKAFHSAQNLTIFRNFPDFLKNLILEDSFKNCTNLKNISLGKNTISKSKNCFANCKNLENVNLENINLEENANLKGMFLNCKSIKNIQGIETLVKKDDKADVNNMFEGAIVNGNLDLSQWGDKIRSKRMLKNSKIKKLKLFNLKKIFEYNIEFLKKEIENRKKLINNYKKDIEDLGKKLDELDNKEPKTDEDDYNIGNYEYDIETAKNNIVDYENEIKKLENEINRDGDRLYILEGSIIDELYISEEFMPNKEDLDRVLGNNCTVKILYVIDKDGNQKRYDGFDNYKNGIEYKDPEPINSEDQHQDEKIEQIENNDELEKINKNQYCFQCLKCCCCCCHNNNNLLGKKRNRE